MANTVTVRPGKDRRVRMPDGRVLTEATTPAEGVVLPRDVFMHRRLACGDLVEVIAPEPAPAKPAQVDVATEKKGA